MSRMKIIMLLLLVTVAAGAFTGYVLFNKKVKNLAEVKPDLSISATELIKKFETSEEEATKEFISKKDEMIIAVSGTVKNIINDEKTGYTIMLGDNSVYSSVQCSIDSLYGLQAGLLKKGMPVTIKGAITGFKADDLGIGAAVILNRCVIVSKK